MNQSHEKSAGNLCPIKERKFDLQDLSNLCHGEHEMTITILAVAGIQTDDRPNEIPDMKAN